MKCFLRRGSVETALPLPSRGGWCVPPSTDSATRLPPGVNTVQLCRERDISINKLCTMSGVTQSTVNNIVSGRNKSVTISTIKKLCDGRDMPIEDFFKSDLFKGLEQELK